MMTKRSNHMPMLMKIEITSSAAGDERTRRDHSTCGTATLQTTIVQNAHAYGPKARLMNTNCSSGLPPYQAVNHSVAYEKATSDPVSSVIFAIRSRWWSVM